MKINEIIEAVKAVTGSYSEASFRRDISRLKIVPLGLRKQRPQQFAPSVPAAILALRGYEAALMPITPLPPLDAAAARLASMPELRKVRKSARTLKGKDKR